jgi:hypothetical protein
VTVMTVHACNALEHLLVVLGGVFNARWLLQGFFSKRSGCIFKWVKKGSPAAAPWHILLREGDAAWQVRSTIIVVCVSSDVPPLSCQIGACSLATAAAHGAVAPCSNVVSERLSAATLF